jgi:hypothetical protein
MLKWYWYLAIVFLILIIIKLATRKKKDGGDSNIMERAKNRVKNIGDCCKKFFKGSA